MCAHLNSHPSCSKTCSPAIPRPAPDQALLTSGLCMILASSDQSPDGQQVYVLSGAEDAGNQESQRGGKAKSPGHVEGPGRTAGLRREMRTPGCGWSPKEEKSSHSRLPRRSAAVGKLPFS